MKKQFFYAAAFVAITGSLIFNACEKEKFEQTIEFVQSESDALVIEKINIFIDRVQQLKENPGLKNAYEALSLEDAVWYTEAALNYTHASAGNGFAEITVDSIEIDITIDDGLIAFSDAADVYRAMYDNLEEFFANIAGNNKQVIIVDVEPVITNNKSSRLTLKVKTVVGTGQQAGTGDVFTGTGDVFNNTDYWYYGENLGKCSSYEGEETGKDAAYLLQYHLNNDNHDVNPYPYFYTHIVSKTIEPIDYENTDDDISEDNLYDFLLFYNNPVYDNYDKCLEPVEMNFYLDGAYYIIDEELDDINREISDPDLFKEFASCEVKDASGKNYDILHYIIINYGVKRPVHNLIEL